MGKLKKAIKKSVKLLIPVFVLAALIGGGYYWHKKKNEPPGVVTYSSARELKSEMERLEGLKSKSWQDTYRLGVAYLYAKKDADAAKTLEEAARLYPRYHKIYESLGMAYYRLGDFEKAKKAWEYALNAAPASSPHIKELIAVAERRLDYRNRASSLEKTISGGGGGWRTRYELATLYAGLNRIDDAIFNLKEAVKEKKDSPEIFDALARLYATRGDFGSAILAEKKALRLRPGDEAMEKRLVEMERLRDAIKKGEFHETPAPQEPSFR